MSHTKKIKKAYINMKKQIGDDDRLKPDDWQLERCMNCEHLRESISYWCAFYDTIQIENPEIETCDNFKQCYRNYKNDL